MRAKLKSLGFSGTGSKAQLWARLTSMELERKREQRQMQMLAQRAEDLSTGRIPHTPVIFHRRKSRQQMRSRSIT
eukprot:659886-Amphidinium_carterae.1